MELTPHQRDQILEARRIVERLKAAGGSLHVITPDEAGLLMDVIAINEEHQQDPPADQLIDIMDRHFE